MMHVLLALALASSSPDALSLDDLTVKVCGHATEVLGLSEEDGLGHERYVGRMEIRMRELELSEGERELTRALCHAYLKGATHAIEMINRRVKEETEKSR